MRKDTRKQLDSLIVYLALKYGVNWRSHLTELAPFWKGPLDRDSIFMSRYLLWHYQDRVVAKMISSMNSFEIHPLYTRDFIQGVLDSSTSVWGTLTFLFEIGNKPDLKEFFESGECGFDVKFTRYEKRKSYRTQHLPFLNLPCKGELDKYFAGVLTGSVPYKDKTGEVFCKVKRKCIPNLKRLGIIFKAEKNFVLISAFYLMLFCGEIPEQIYFKWINILSEIPVIKMKTACTDAYMHWRQIFEKKEFKTGMLPYLIGSNFYRAKVFIRLKDLKKLMEEKRFDFVDEKIKNRCKRWYNIHVQKKS